MLIKQKVGCMFENPQTDILQEYFGHIFQYKKSNKWWKVKWLDGEVSDYTFWEMTEFSSPPNFDDLKYTEPATAAMEFLNASNGDTSCTVAGDTFLLEGQMYVFITVLFVSASDPFIGCYCAQENYEESLCDQSYEEFTANKLVHLTPMPTIKKWLAASKAFTSNLLE